MRALPGEASDWAVNAIVSYIAVPRERGGEEGRGLSRYRRRWTRTALRIIDSDIGTFLELFEQVGALETHAQDGATRAPDSRDEEVVGVLNLDDPLLDFLALLAVRFLHRGGKRCAGSCYG